MCVIYMSYNIIVDEICFNFKMAEEDVGTLPYDKVHITFVLLCLAMKCHVIPRLF